MVRVNPMDRRRVAEPRLAGLLEEAAALELAAGRLAEAACDDLYRLVPEVPEHLRGRVLAWRRDIHNGRGGPDAMTGAGEPATASIEWPDSIAHWADHQRRRLAAHAQVRQAYEVALTKERSWLRERLGEGNFLTTLAQSAPGVYDTACRYRGHAVADAKDRKAERALVQYLTRAMVRTSPYGRFTAVGLAHPDPAGLAMDAVTPDAATPQIETDRALFSYVLGGLVPTPAGDDPLLSLPPTARVNGDQITFFQVRPGSIRRLGAPLTPQTRLLVELLDLGPYRRSALAAALAARLALDLATACRLLDVAVGLGLLVTTWRGHRFVAEPVDEAMRDLADAGADSTVEALRQFRVHLHRLSDADLTPTGRIGIARRLDAAGDALSRLAGRPAKLAVNEDFVLDPSLVDPEPYRAALDDLGAVAELSSAFDRMHVVRALVAVTLVERFGPGCQVPLVDHAEGLVRAVYQAERRLAEDREASIGPADGSLAMLAKVRGEALTALHQDLATTNSDGGPGCVQWSPRDITALVAGVPDRFRADPASYALVVQAHEGQLIVNDTYAGHGPMVSRFLHASQLRGGNEVVRLRSRLRALYGPDVRLLEDRGHHNISINAHPPVLDDDAGLDAEGWQRLRLAHDIATDTVSIVDAAGAPVKVLALGAQLPELFPYPVRLATWLSSSGRVVLDVPAKLHRRLSPPDGQAAGHRDTVGYRRLRVGSVIVSRRRWYPGSDFPTATPEGVEYLLALTAWRARNQVPAEVMLKSVFDGPTSWETVADAESHDRFFEIRKRSKPQYVDLASALMARILPRLLERRPPGCVEEALPGLAQGGQAREWMVEVSRPAGRENFDWRPDSVALPDVGGPR